MNSRKNFYCQNLYRHEDFEIEEFNQLAEKLQNSGMSTQDQNKILFPEGCEEQCDSCINIVLDTKAKNKEKYIW